MKYPRCISCLLPEPNCICQKIPMVESPVSFVLVQHWKEQFKSSNTGRLLSLAVKDTHCFLNDSPEELQQLSLFLQEKSAPYLVFPSENSLDIEEVKTKIETSPKPIRFVLLDGSWRQATRMRKRVKAISSLPCISLNPKAPSYNPLRKQRNSFHLSTIETAILLMKSLGCKDVERLEDFFHLMVQQSLIARGKLKTLAEFEQKNHGAFME